MGIFRRNHKVCPIAEAIELLQTKKYKGYTVIKINESNNTCVLAPEEAALKEAREDRKREQQYKQQQVEFSNRITGYGAYQENIRISNEAYSWKENHPVTQQSWQDER